MLAPLEFNAHVLINALQIHYAHVTPKPKPEGLPDQPVDPTAVVYSEVKNDKMATESEESEETHQTMTGVHLYLFICVLFCVNSCSSFNDCTCSSWKQQ